MPSLESMSMNLFDSPSNSQEQNEETRAPLVSSGGVSSRSAERNNIDFNRSSSSSSPPRRPSDDYDYDYEYKDNRKYNRKQENDSSPNTTLAVNDDDANYTATYTGAFPSHHHRNFFQGEDERQQEEQQQDEKMNQFEEEETADDNNAESKSHFNALNQSILTENNSHSEQHYDISTPPTSPPPASRVGRTTIANSSNHHSSHTRQNANANANADGNNRSLFQTSNQWIPHNMEEATRMIRDLEQSLEELHRIQVQNAIVMDHLVMAGAD